MLKFLRRDPTVYLTILQTAIALALTFHPFGITDTFIPLYVAAMNAIVGIVTAVLTKRSGFSFGIGLLQAIIALMAGYGLPLTDEQTNGAMFLTTLILGLFNWTANAPAETPGLRNEPMVVAGQVTNVIDEPSTCATVPRSAVDSDL